MPQLDIVSYFSQFTTLVFIWGMMYGVIVLRVLPSIKYVGLIKKRLESQNNFDDSMSLNLNLHSCCTLLVKIIS